ncbi:MAG: putative amidohydrolase YtcJ [Saprospiraceae bacterium]|jgi:predicted amidohydrolase YtcJ
MIRKYVILALFFALGACQSTEKGPDLIIHNAYIYSVDSDKSVYEAIAIKGQLVYQLGSETEILKLQEAHTEVIDAEGAFVIPGLIEGHGHFSGYGQSLINLNFLKSKSWEEIVSMVEARAKETPKGEWIYGRGWHQEKWEEVPEDHVHGYPRHFDLSELVPDHPVLLVHASGHGLIANAKAMEISGVTPETPNPAGGEIVRDDLGNAIGVFEERAQNIVRQAYSYYLEEQSDEERLDNWYKGIDLAQKGCLENGITSFQDAGAGFEDMERYRKMADEGAFKIRLWSMLRESASSLKGKTAQERIIGAGDNHFTCRAIKTEVDGALGSFGAWMLESYDDKENFVGQNTTPIEEVEAIAKLAMETDMQLCVHAIGDRANREVLDIMEPYIKSSNKDLRWRIEHSQHISSEDIPRFGSLGVIASMQGIHCTSDSPFVEKRLGRERARIEAYPWRGLIDNDAVVTNGTDVPVEDINPIESLYASMTRKRIDNGFEFFPENAMTRDEAIYSYTMANAFAAFEENIKGSLEIGKLADITILSQNLRTCSEDSLLDTKILYTIVSGEVLYEAE